MRGKLHMFGLFCKDKNQTYFVYGCKYKQNEA